MKLIAARHASEIFDLGDGRVLRRFRAGGDPEREALVMGHARGHGYPVPRVDLHPDNVILSPGGPFVIDWTNARRGDPALDVALIWVIVATSGGPLARLFLRWFLPHFDRDDLLHALPAAAERRLADVNVSDRERRAVRRFIQGAGVH